MKPNRLLSYFIALFLFTGFSSLKIDNPPIEKIHLHLDKPYYAVGDNIWFKAYVTDEQNNLSDLSNELYVELINDRDSLIRQIKLPLSSGLAWGDFKLTEDFQEGNYRIRAYTQWMRNAGPDYFFDKTIKIGNSWSNEVFTHTTYSFNQIDDKSQLNTSIKFTDKEDKAYSKCPVSFQVILNGKIITRGSGKTNEDGAYNLSMTTKSPDTSATATIRMVLILKDKSTVVKYIPVNDLSDGLAVQFFPESGNLVQGFTSKVGVKAVRINGIGEDIEGTVTDESGNKVVDFRTTHLGMGKFIFSPQAGKTYKAKIKRKNGNLLEVPLPHVRSNGYVLTVDNSDVTQVKAKITRNTGPADHGNIKLLLQHNGSIDTLLNADNQTASFLIPKKNRGSGIFRFTVFDGSDLPVCERLIFIKDPSDQITTEVLNLKKEYAKREEISFDLSAKDAGQPTRGSFSIAVTNTAIVEPDPQNESNILTSLLFTSDLKGYIEKPNYYINNDGPEAQDHLDNLMLTQGWNRFVWKSLKDTAANDVPPSFPAEKSLKISGTVTTLGTKPLADAKITLESTNHGYLRLDTITNNKGRFNFSNLIYADSTKFVIHAFNAKHKNNVSLQLDEIPGQAITKNRNKGDLEVNINDAIQNYVKKGESYFNTSNKNGINLKQINIKGVSNSANSSLNLNGPGRADFVFNAYDLSLTTNIYMTLDNLMAGIMVKDRIPYLIDAKLPMMIVVDRLTVQASFLDFIDTKEIQTIEVLRYPNLTNIYGEEGKNGVLLITTLSGKADMNRKMNGVAMVAPKGYYKIREFYSPKYTPNSTTQESDKRSTVYWKPNVLTKLEEKSKISFFSADDPGIYRIVIEGINNYGHLARSVYTCTVK